MDKRIEKTVKEMEERNYKNFFKLLDEQRKSIEEMVSKLVAKEISKRVNGEEKKKR